VPERESLNGGASVINLLFPVKPSLLHAVLIGLFVIHGCGYAPLYGSGGTVGRFWVEASEPKVPRTDAVQAVLAGARSELARSGSLSSEEAYPHLVIEVLRIDEISSGITAAEQPDGSRVPEARGSSVAVVGRAWVEQRAGADPTRDTADVRRVEHYATHSDPRVEGLRHDEAVRAASAELGRALARRVIGLPEPDMEPM
jgi:hypothetical protein